MEILKKILLSEKIEYYSVLPLEKLEVINPRLLPEKTKTAIIFLIPYRTEKSPSSHLAKFAVSKDYHLFSKELFQKIIPMFEEAFPINNFWGFADHSPLNERKSAFEGGLGDIGLNNLLINEKYGSFVFIAEILTDAVFPEFTLPKMKLCDRCNICMKVCPKKQLCISEISQKKRKTEEDLAILKETQTVWGCDKCQDFCPVNEKAELSPFDFFYKDRINFTDILSLSENEFKNYAFSFRGRNVIEENIRNILKKDID